MSAAVIIAAWVFCGFLAYGRALAHFQRKYPTSADEYRNADRVFALFQAALGPGGLVVSLVCGCHGFMWRLPTRHNS